MIKINKYYLLILFAMCSNLNAMEQLYVSTISQRIINVVSGAFLDRLQDHESIAAKRSITDIRTLKIELDKKKDECSTSITEADWLYWKTLESVFKSDTPVINDGYLNAMLKAANDGCEDAREAVRISCAALSYSDAIAEGEYSVKECLKSRILRSSNECSSIGTDDSE